MKSKANLRRELKAKRWSLSGRQVTLLSKKINRRLAKLKEIQKSQSFCIYVAVDNEVQTQALIKKLLLLKRIVTVPKIISNKKMLACQITDWRHLKPGRFKILEPVNAIPYQNNLEICILPSLAVTKKGHRLGRGRGYYDWFLKNNQEMLVIAPIYSFQLIEQIPIKSTDSLVDIIITEDEIIRCQG